MNRKPLRGKVIVLTRSVQRNKVWKKYFEKLGATVHSFPTIETIPHPFTASIRRILEHITLEQISAFDWIIFTSAEGMRSMKLISLKAHIRLSPITMPPIAVLGSATAKAVRVAGYAIAFQSSIPTSIALGKELTPVKKKSILLLQTNIASRSLVNILRKRGAKVVSLPIYKTVIRKGIPDPIFSKKIKTSVIDYITFASPSAVKGFSANLDKDTLKSARKLTAVAIGVTVQKALTKAGFQNIIVAKEPTVEGMVHAMDRSTIRLSS